MGKADATIKFDLANHVSEILSGVDRGNSEQGSALQVEAIEVVSDDYPGKGQAEYVAYKIALAVPQAIRASTMSPYRWRKSILELLASALRPTVRAI